MKTERIVLSFIAVVGGILVAAIAFYLYQSTKTISPSETKSIVVRSQNPTTPLPTQPQSTIFLIVNNPKDEDVVDTKTITVSGKTTPNAVVIVTTSTDDEILTPAQNGDFATTVTITDGTNQITITAIAQNGGETSVVKTITYSTESF